MSVQPATNDGVYGHRSDNPGEAAAISLQQILGFIRSGGWLVGIVVVGSLACGLLFDLLSTPRYVATSQVIIDPRGLQLVDKQVTTRGETADSDIAIVEDEMQVLKSSDLLSDLIDKEDLLNSPYFGARGGGIIGTMESLISHQVVDPANARLIVLQQLNQQIAVRRVERGYVVDIVVTTSNPQESARLANRLVALYITQANKTRSDLAKRSSVGLGDRLDELQANVRKADERVETYRSDNNLVSTGGVLTSDQRLKDLTSQLVLARTREDEAKSRLDQIAQLQAGGNLDAIPEALQSQVVIGLRDQLSSVRRRLSTLKDQLGPRHPDFVSATDELQTLDHLLAQELKRLAQAARIEYARARDSELSIKRSSDVLSQASLNDSKSIVMLRELERDADASRALFTAFLARSQELGEQTRLDTTNVRQISVAMPPLGRANASHAVVLVVSLMLGLLLGAGLAILLGMMGFLFKSGPIWGAHPARRAT